ncbi:MAG: 2-C-methyl-D-erythritol 4-phosphate cytidylyltransferase [Mycoplasmoidaceae bacterium]|nr:2-C-methyl-D-erythritol 4-phosphate cytidylyltransferase [Mycoplasmoidaceae bacterium]
MANYAIILAAGDGKRLGSKTPKCFIQINKKPIYQYGLELFQIFSQIKQIILVVPKQYLSLIKVDSKKIKIVTGGKTRNESFECGIRAISHPKAQDKIIIHDAARINLQPEDILKILNSKMSYGTLCYLGKPNKSDLRFGQYNIQTPQFCKFFVYKHTTKNKCGRDLFTYLNAKPTKGNFIISSNKSQN